MGTERPVQTPSTGWPQRMRLFYLRLATEGGWCRGTKSEGWRGGTGKVTKVRVLKASQCLGHIQTDWDQDTARCRMHEGELLWCINIHWSLFSHVHGIVFHSNASERALQLIIVLKWWTRPGPEHQKVSPDISQSHLGQVQWSQQLLFYYTSHSSLQPSVICHAALPLDSWITRNSSPQSQPTNHRCLLFWNRHHKWQWDVDDWQCQWLHRWTADGLGV